MELTDKFSWRRVWMLTRLYLPWLRKHLWAFPLASALLSGVTVIAMALNPTLTPSAFTFTIGITIMYNFAPIVLARRDYRALSDQLPVLASEKVTFLAIYFLLVTLALTTGVQTLVYFLSSFIFPRFSNHMQELYGIAVTIYPAKTMIYMSYVTGMAMPSLTLLGVVWAKRNRMLKGILTCVVAYLSVTIIGGILSFVMAMAKLRGMMMEAGFDINVDLNPQSEVMIEIMSEVVNVVVWVVTGLSVAAIVVAWLLIYKKMKRGGF